MNFHRLRLAWFPCLLPVILTGCSSTMVSRFGGTPQTQPKSIAVVGDRPVSVATGEPGSKVVAAADPEPKNNPRGRISGRVVDDQGEPIANATVRLADGGTKGGKDVRGTTDKSGAFTLNGLRPGSTYSLIAEDEEGTLTGGISAKTSDPRVEITLLSEEAIAKNARKTRPAKARPISSRDESVEEPTDDRRPTVNHEDLDLPAESAETIDPGPPTESARPQLAPPQAVSGWQNTRTASKPKSRTEDSEAIATSTDDSPRRSRVLTIGSGSDEDEEGPNPLPPAIEPNQTDEPAPKKPTSARLKPTSKPKPKPPVKQPDSGEMSLAPETSAAEKPEPRRSVIPETVVAAAELPLLAPVGPLDGGTASALLPDRVELAKSAGPPELPPVGEPVAPPATASGPPDLPPVAASTVPNNPTPLPATQPVFASQATPNPVPTPAPAPTPAKPADYNPFALVGVVSVPPPSTIDLRPTTDRSPSPITTSTESTEPDQSASASSKTKWGDLTVVDPKPRVKVEPTKATLASSLVKRFRPNSAPEKADASIALCSYDSRLLKMKDFRLPDLEGKPVSFHDFGADYVLVDFWGTWCSPCVDSIPHLIELQKKYGPSRLTVVGIACEQVAPEKRKAKVEEVARKMGINYPILLSTMDGKACPVQQALAVQAMPTMILFDRKGQVIWRSTGATPANESRLDRVLASKLGSTDTARR